MAFEEFMENIGEGLQQFSSQFGQSLASGSTQKVTGQLARLTQAARKSSFSTGDSGHNVKLIQGALKNLGYYKGSINGQYGSSTKDAVKQFQKEEGLAATGSVDYATAQALQQATKAKKQRGQIIPELINIAAQRGMQEIAGEYPQVFRGTQPGGGARQGEGTKPTITPTKTEEGMNAMPWLIGGGLLIGVILYTRSS